MREVEATWCFSFKTVCVIRRRGTYWTPGAMFCHATGNSGGAGAESVEDELPMDIAICAGDDGLARYAVGRALGLA